MRFDNLQALDDISRGDSLFLFADGATTPTTTAIPIPNEYVEYVKNAIAILSVNLFQITQKIGQLDLPNLAIYSEINIGLRPENLSISPESFGKLLISVANNPNSTNPNEDNLVKSCYFYFSIFDSGNSITNGVSFDPTLSIAENLRSFQTYISSFVANFKNPTPQQIQGVRLELKAKYDGLNIPPKVVDSLSAIPTPRNPLGAISTNFYNVPLGTIVEVANIGANNSVNWMVAPNLANNDNGYREASVGEYRILNTIDPTKVRVEILQNLNKSTRPIFMASSSNMGSIPQMVETMLPVDMVGYTPPIDMIPSMTPVDMNTSMVKIENGQTTDKPRFDWKTLSIVGGVIVAGYYLIKKKII
jgi:hypothetical protein